MTPEFTLQEIVFLKTDPEMLPRIITGYKVSVGYVSYEVACGAFVSWHYGYEMTREKLSNGSKPGFGK